MRGLADSLRLAAAMMRGGQTTFVADRLRRAVWSERRFVVLRRDLSAPEPRSPVSFTVRPFEPADIRILDGEPLSAMEALAKDDRRRWIEGGLPGCHVATLKDGEPCYMQWVMRAADNDAIHAFFGDTLPAIDARTVLMEGAYTAPRYRRLPIMPAAMARISGLGRQWGAREAVVAVAEENASMVKATRLAGFVPESLETERRRLFRRSATYAALGHDPEKWEPVFGKDHAQTERQAQGPIQRS